MVKNYSNLPTYVDVIFTQQLEMRIHSHLLAQTLSPLSFRAKLLFGYIQIFLELGVLILHFFKLKNNSDKFCDHSQTHKQYQMLLETKISFSTDILSKYFLGKLRSLTWVSISFLEHRRSSSKAWASFFSCIKPFFSFVICSRASAVLPEASVA